MVLVKVLGQTVKLLICVATLQFMNLVTIRMIGVYLYRTVSVVTCLLYTSRFTEKYCNGSITQTTQPTSSPAASRTFF